MKYVDPSGHRPVSLNGDDDGYSLDELFQEDVPPHPDAPPDYNNPLPNGHPAPPHIPGLPDDQWEWNDEWPGAGEGYQNKEDPTGTVWQPNKGYTNKKGNEGEMPHWHGTRPGFPRVNFPDNYQWGRRGQRNYPGEYDPASQAYNSSPNIYLPEVNFPQVPAPSPTSALPLIAILLLLTPVLIFVP